MPKIIQVRDVSDRVHRILKARAAREGMSLSEFVKQELERSAERPTQSDTQDAQSRETGLELEQEPEGTMDWSDCPLVEVKPGVQRGRPVLKGPRMPADDIVENWEAGVDEPDIAANFRLPITQVRAILSYAAAHQDAPHPVR